MARGLSSRAVSTPSSPVPLRGILLIGLAAMSWGTTGSVTTVLVERAAASPLVIGVVRLWAAAVLLSAAALVARGSLRLPAPDTARCIAMGACMAAFQVTYFTAVTLTGIAVTALLAICSAPLTIAALAWGVLGERPVRLVVVALAVGVAGTVLLVTGTETARGAAEASAVGALLALGAGVSYAVYAVIAKLSVTRSAPLPVAALTFTAAALILTPALLWAVAPGRQLALGWPWLLYLGSVTTAGAYAAYTAGLRHVPASVAGIVTLLEPLTATLLAVLVFGERLGPGGVLGAALLFAALGLLIRAQPR